MYVSGPNVAKWVFEKTSGNIAEDHQAIGQTRGNRLIAATAYENYNGHNVYIHQRIDEAPSRSFWAMFADYPFNQLGCSRITGLISSDNKKSIRLAEKVGFELEATMKKAGENGQDMLIYVLWKEKCRFLSWRKFI